MNHTRFPKEDHLPDWARRDNKVTKGDRVDYTFYMIPSIQHDFSNWHLLTCIYNGKAICLLWSTNLALNIIYFKFMFTGWQR